MKELISRQDVLDYIDTMPSELTSDGRRMIRRVRLTEYIADTLPSARRKAEWIEAYEDERKQIGWYECSECPHYDPKVWMCSECKHYEHKQSNYCPNCGADMRGEKDEI